MKFTMNRFHYDNDNDILYYTIGDKSNSYGDEEPDNIVIMRDIETDVMTGITVLNFRSMYETSDDRMEILLKYFDVNSVIRSL